LETPVADEPRTDANIRSEISAEREQLVDALADLREGIEAKRRHAAALGMLIAAGLQPPRRSRSYAGSGASRPRAAHKGSESRTAARRHRRRKTEPHVVTQG
jgi:hypothetical protein